MSKPRRLGMILIISAPSGAGKSTLIRKLREEFSDFVFSISYTTRPPREGEVDGKDYRFVTEEEFLVLRDSKCFAEWAKVHDNYYGTPLDETLNHINNGRNVIFDIDVQGAESLKNAFGRCCMVFIFPPSLDVLRERLTKRGAETEDRLRKRLENAYREIDRARVFDYWIVNDDLDKAYSELRSVFIAERSRPEYRPDLKNLVLSSWKREE